MDKDKVIEVAKKNILSIVAGVVALVAVGFMFFWVSPRVSSTDPQSGSVKQRVSARAAKAQEITTLLNAQRPAPTFTPSGDSGTLGQFPTNRIIQQGREAMEAVKAQADQVLDEAQQLNRRVPLGWESYEAADADWPLDGDQKSGQRDRFRQEYNRWTNADNSLFSPEDGSYQSGTIHAELRATRPPTDQEIQAEDALLEARVRSEVPIDEATGQPRDPEQFAALMAQRRIELAAGMKYRRARDHWVYIDQNGPPGSRSGGLSIHPFSAAQRITGVDCFNAQLGLWVQETVLSNLMEANQEALGGLPTEQQNLLNAPVKHIISISVPNAPIGEARETIDATGEDTTPAIDSGALRRPNRPPAGGEGEGAEGAGESEPAEETEAGTETTEEAAVPIDPTAVIQRQHSISPSGRPRHTPFYDLVEFQVVVRCDAQAVSFVLKKLQADSFLTVLNMSMTAVDPAAAAQQGYVYGDGPVVQLNLQCEMPFLRSWLVPLMPAGLQEALAAEAAPPATE